MLAVITVTSDQDNMTVDGFVTLREAIEAETGGGLYASGRFFPGEPTISAVKIIDSTISGNTAQIFSYPEPVEVQSCY
ncbi:MAG: hypothetical protein ACC645_21605 [Pirellulales bacterium]